MWFLPLVILSVSDNWANFLSDIDNWTNINECLKNPSPVLSVSSSAGHAGAD